MTTPQFKSPPACRRGALNGHVMTEAEIAAMDRLARIKRMMKPVSLTVPPYSARIDMMVLVAMIPANDPNPPSSPDAAMRAA